MLRNSPVRALLIALCSVLLVLGGGAPAGAAGPGATSISAGGMHACAVRSDKTAWCWGYDYYGELGDGTRGDDDAIRSTPVQVLRGSSPLTNVTKVSTGDRFSCALRTDKTVWCWGQDANGELGDGTTGDANQLRLTAVQVRRGSGHLTGVTKIAAGDLHVCALRTDTTVWCWGEATYGQVGDGTTGDPVTHLRTKARQVRQGTGFLSGVIGIAAGGVHSCAVKKDGSAWCWGDGSYGQLGDGVSGSGHQRTKAARVKLGSGSLTKVATIAAGGSHTCVRRTDGSAWCWGSAEQGQLGDGTTGSGGTHARSKPVRVRKSGGFLTGVAGVAAGGLHSCARRTDGSAWCWGLAQDGQLGDGTTGDANHVRLKAVRVRRATATFTKVRALSAGSFAACAVRTDQTAWCWGDDEEGQLGIGTADDDSHPYPIKVLFP